MGVLLQLKRECTKVYGDVVAQLVECWPRDPMDSMIRGSNSVRSTRKMCESYSESKMLYCVCPTPVCIRTYAR